MNISSLDFQQARIKLVVFKSRLRSMLYGVREAEPALFSVRDNPFGQWLAATLTPRFGPVAEVRGIERALGQMLRHGQELLALYRQGHIERARAGLEQIDAYAAEIEALLQRLEVQNAA